MERAAMVVLFVLPDNVSDELCRWLMSGLFPSYFQPFLCFPLVSIQGNEYQSSVLNQEDPSDTAD